MNKVKIRVISDLHQEFGFREISFSGADLVVFAGDTNLGIKGIEWIKARIKTVPVIYVLGNHEYYKGAYPKTLNKIVEAAHGSNIHVLENKAVVIDGITFHGATLWTNFELFGNPKVSGSLCQSTINDYRMIRKEPAYSKLRSIDTYQIHQISIQWLEQSLASSLTKHNIVVTHHAPSAQSVPEVYKNDITSAAFASHLDDFILKHQPDYWIHGHIHQPSRYNVGKTVVLCNPHGYLHDRDQGFDPGLTIEVPA